MGTGQKVGRAGGEGYSFHYKLICIFQLFNHMPTSGRNFKFGAPGWLSQLSIYLTLDIGSSHDVTVPAWDSSLPLSAPPLLSLSHSLFLSENKHNKKEYRNVMFYLKKKLLCTQPRA